MVTSRVIRSFRAKEEKAKRENSSSVKEQMWGAWGRAHTEPVRGRWESLAQQHIQSAERGGDLKFRSGDVKAEETAVK